MATLLEMAADIVSAFAATNNLNPAELVTVIGKVHSTLKALEAGESIQITQAEEPVKPAMTWKQSIKNNEVICLLCGKGGMKTLTRHLTQHHNMKPGQYRKQFDIPSTQSLTAKAFSKARKEMAQKINLSANLEKARQVRMANIAAKKEKPVKAKGKAKKGNATKTQEA